jgi:hypothetical protein
MEQEVTLKANFPSTKINNSIIENKVISDLPDIRRSTCNDLKETWSREGCFGGSEVDVKSPAKIPVNIQEVPTFLRKFTLEEEMLSRFQSVLRTHSTIISGVNVPVFTEHEISGV